MFAAVGLVCVLSSLAAHQPYQNSFSVIIPSIIYAYKAGIQDNTLDFGFYFPVLCGALWLTVLNFLNYYKFKALYAEILKNRKQNNEMRKILHLFPKSVIISTSEPKRSHSYFVNKDFEEKIAKIK